MDEAEYSLSLNEPIDGISANPRFDLLATVQRRRERYRQSFLSVVTLFKLDSSRLSVVKELTHRIGRQTQSSQTSIAWSPLKEKTLACTTPSGNTLLWDLNHPEEIASIYPCGVSFAKVKFHYFDEYTMGVGSSDSSLLLYDIRTSTKSIQFSGVTCVRDFDFGRHVDTQNTIVTVGDGGRVKFYDFRKPNKPFRELFVHQGQIMSVMFNKKEKHLVSTGGRDKFIKMWDWSKDGTNLHSIETPSAVGKILWTNADDWQICSVPAVTTSSDVGDFSTYIWDFRRPYFPYKCSRRHNAFVSDAVFPANSSLGVFCSSDFAGRVMYHKIANIGMPIKNVDTYDVTASNVENECIITKPMDDVDLNDKYYSNSENFGKKIKSKVLITEIGEENSDSKKFKFLATSYKLFSQNNETVLDLCKYNSNVAFALGDIDLSRAWDVLGVTANNDVISSVRASLGQQLRPPVEEVFLHDECFADIPEEPVETETDNKEDSPKDEIIELIEPNKEFCFDQELLDFCCVLEEESEYHIPDEMISGKLIRTRSRKFRPKLQIPNREEWYTGSALVSPELSPQIKHFPQRRYHRHYLYHHRTPSASIKNTTRGQVKRTLVSSVFDNSQLSKDMPLGRRTSNQTLEKVKETYDQKMADRKQDIAAAIKRKTKKKLTKEQIQMAKRRRAHRKIREMNLRWIESNRILQSTRTPLNVLQRIIIDKSAKYYEKKILHESVAYKRGKSLKRMSGFKPYASPDSWKTIKFIFDYYMALDDVQTCACMAMCIGEKVTMLIPEVSVDHWFYYYIETLEQYSLYKEATAFMKASFRVSSTQKTFEENFLVNSKCVECGNQLFHPVCRHCSTEHFCLICETLVHSHWLVCTECGHGGHLDHITDWFEENDTCPATNCEHACFPKLEMNPVEARITKSLQIANSHKRHFDKRPLSFWAYKIPLK